MNDSIIGNGEVQKNKVFTKVGAMALSAALVLSLGVLGTGYSYLHSYDEAKSGFENNMNGKEANELLKITADAIEDAGDFLPTKTYDVNATVELSADAIDNAAVSVAVTVPATNANITSKTYRAPEGYHIDENGRVVSDSDQQVNVEETAKYTSLFSFTVEDGWTLTRTISNAILNGSCLECSQTDKHTADCSRNVTVYEYSHDTNLTPGQKVDLIKKVTALNVGTDSPEADQIKYIPADLEITYSVSAYQEAVINEKA